MAARHAFSYSKSTRARCHGPPPCNGTPMEVGTFRHGAMIPGQYGENVEWKHWGCVSPSVLTELSSVALDSIPGFKNLKPQDRERVRLALSLRRINPADVPASARPAPTTDNYNVNKTNGKKRKPIQSDPKLSAAPDMPPPGACALTLPGTSQPIEDDAVEEESEDIRDELYCTMNTNVVGIQYYHGLVGPGEEVVLMREPHNPYDSQIHVLVSNVTRNAIQVNNISQTQVGHLPRQVAAKLAPLLDSNLVTVEGVIKGGNLHGRTSYTLSLTLRIYGLSEMRHRLEPRLIWATPGQRGFSRESTLSSSQNRAPAFTAEAGPSRLPHTSVRNASEQKASQQQQERLQKAAELRQILAGLEKVDDESRRSSLLDSLCTREDILNLPVQSNPPGIKNGILKVDLLKHQSQALRWCIEREYPVLPKNVSDKPVQFWQLCRSGNKDYYYNIATKTPQETIPLLGRGALCADAMGLGKTLTMLALILTTKDDVPEGFQNSTLIVAPLSVLSNWEKQITDHCTTGSLSTCVYYSANRSMSAEQLSQFDIVITTYQVVAGEFNERAHGEPDTKKTKTERTLFSMQWKRIILDEGHTIRNSKTKTAKAVFRLTAQRRWILTGTPIINSPRDLGSILSFLQVCHPLNNEDFFKRLLLRPLKNGDTSGAELLRGLLNQICIRRTKEMQDSSGRPLISLPPVDMIVVPVKLNDEARSLYDEVEEVSKRRLEDYMSGGTNTTMQSNVLSMLTRMRQLALHPGLIPPDYLESLRAKDIDGSQHPTTQPNAEEILRLQSLLSQALEDSEECPVCFGILADARITKCGHMFCFSCIAEVIARDPKCPMDRRPLSMSHLFQPLPSMDLSQPAVQRNARRDAVGVRGQSSAKIDQLIQLLRLTPCNEKSLVFSQFTSFLDKIAEAFDKESISYVRFDGQMSARRRQEAIAQFSIPLPDREANLAESSDNQDVMYEDGLHYLRETPNPKVMLLSLKSGAVGLNLTVANNVFLMDPWWQEGIESQAIDRVNRIGQKKSVRVYQLIAENTVESKVLEIQTRKRGLIQQAFSGKRTETQRQRREARLQDIIQIFSLRERNTSE